MEDFINSSTGGELKTDPDQMLSLRQVASILGSCEKTIRRMCEKGDLRYHNIRPGKERATIRIRRSVMIDFINKCEVHPVARASELDAEVEAMWGKPTKRARKK